MKYLASVLVKNVQNGMHNYKFAYELQDKMGMVLYGHSSRRISIQINGTGCALARKGWQVRLYQYLTSYQKFYDPQTGFFKRNWPT